MPSRGDAVGRLLGVLVLLLGLSIIVMVLSLAYGLFQDRDVAASLGSKLPGGPTLASMGAGFITLLVKIALLFLGSISGSMVANRGIQLYFTALGKGRPDELPAKEP